MNNLRSFLFPFYEFFIALHKEPLYKVVSLYS